MTRRRLLSLLATTAMLTGVVAGPAAALDLDAPADVTPPAAAAAATAPATTAVADVVTTIGAEAAEAPVVADVVAEPAAPVADAVAPESPAATPRSESVAPESSAPTPSAPRVADVVAAGSVTTAPPIELLLSLGGHEATTGLRGAAPSTTPTAASADQLLAPEIASAPVTPATPVAPAAPAVLAQALDGVPAGSVPALALVAFAALLAAGGATARSAHAEATA